MTDLIIIGGYLVVGAIIGAASAFCWDLEWDRWGWRCPTYGELIVRIFAGAFGGVPMAIVVVLVGVVISVGRITAVHAIMRKSVCRPRK